MAGRGSIYRFSCFIHVLWFLRFFVLIENAGIKLFLFPIFS